MGLCALTTRPQRPRLTVVDPTAPDQVWVGDITYLPLIGGRWYHLATWGNACSRRVVGWHLADQTPNKLVIISLARKLT